MIRNLNYFSPNDIQRDKEEQLASLLPQRQDMDRNSVLT
jgi:hypothetical protein